MNEKSKGNQSAEMGKKSTRFKAKKKGTKFSLFTKEIRVGKKYDEKK